MNKQILRVGVVVLAVVMALALAANALAQGPGGRDDPWRDRGEQLGQRLIDRVAELTGVSSDEILAKLRAGESLIDIAEANGVERDVVIDALKDEVGAAIDAALSDENLGAYWGGMMAGRLHEPFAAWLDGAWAWGADRFDATLAGVIADLGGVELGDMLDEHFTRPSLADIAESYGLDRDAVLAEAEARATDATNQAVADGFLTQAQADALLDGLGERLEWRFGSAFGTMHREFAGHWDRHSGGHGRMWR